MAECFITTSWDDGSPLDLRLAELLHKHGLPATFYVPVKPDAPVLSSAQVRELASRFEIGAHTVQHIPLTRLSLTKAEREMVVSRAQIEQITGTRCNMFCFPQGKHTRTHLRLARNAGYAACRTVALLSMSPPAHSDGILVMPTTAQVYSHSSMALVRNALKRTAVQPLWNWMLCARTLDWVGLAGAFLERALSRGGVFHLWGHSWEIDQFQQWQRLDAFLGRLGQCRNQASFLTNSGICHATASVPAQNV